MIEVVCGVLIIDEKVMIAQRRSAVSDGKFEFPGGKVELYETKEEALIREWKEECGIDIEDIRYLASNVDYQEDEIQLTCYTCTSRQKPTVMNAHSQYVWTTPEHIYDYDFFDSDHPLVDALKEKWPCLIERMKPKY